MKRVVLITGASRGIGKEIANKFIKNKDIVYINYKHSCNFSNIDEKYLIKCDVSKEEEVIKMINYIEKESGHIDILVNNAGIAMDSTLEEKEVSDFKKVLDTNLIGPFLVSKYASRIMNKGVIINISSTNGIDTYYPFSIDYDASKAGLISLTHNFAVLFAPRIRVNAVAPGWVETDMNKNLDKDFKDKECGKILLKRFGNTEEIANVVFFLASDGASYINNTVIRVDGGFYG